MKKLLLNVQNGITRKYIDSSDKGFYEQKIKDLYTDGKIKENQADYLQDELNKLLK